MAYTISDAHDPKLGEPKLDELLRALRGLPVGKAVTVTDEERAYAAFRNYLGTTIFRLKYADGGAFSTKKVGPHSVQVTRTKAATKSALSVVAR